MWHFLPAMMPSSLHAISYASPLRWWILMIPIHFQCTGSKFIGEEIWDLSCNRTCGCHMSSRYKDVLKWKKTYSKNYNRIFGEGGKQTRRNSELFYSFLSLSSSLLLLLNSILFFLIIYWRSTSMPFLAATIITMIWCIWHTQMPLITKITLADTALSAIYL